MKIKKGKPIEELVKGSMEYTMQLIMTAFRAQFPSPESYNTLHYYISEVFSDYVIVSCYGDGNPLKSDEYFKVSYSKSGDVYTFAARDQWEVVELAYQPQTVISEKTSPPAPLLKERGAKRKGTRFEERVNAQVSLQEAEEGKPHRIRIEGAMTANVVNGNKRRYPSSVLESAVAELGGHLNESPGQGRAVQILGEAEHPSDKGGRPNLLETVTKWAEVAFDGSNVNLTGHIVETSKGKDILTLMENGVMPGVSMRGYGEGKNVKNGDEKIFEVTELHITGFDLVLEPSFENAAELIESQSSLEDDMDLLEQLKKLLAEHPELFGKGMTETQLVEMSEKQLKTLEEKVRSALGIDANANITETLKATTEKARKFDEGQKQIEVTKAIEEVTKDLPFGKKLNDMFVTSINEETLRFAQSDNPVEAVKQFAESKRKEYGRLAAAGALKGLGFDEKTKRVQMLGDVLENETDTPEFARASFEITEAVRKYDNRAKRAIVERAESPAAVFTQKILERFDQMFERQLRIESQQFEEATLSTDLNLPYSVSRTVIAEAFPNLVSANVFDMGIMEQNPTRIFFEAFTGETGYSVDVVDEVEAGGAEEVWYDLAHKNIMPGTAIVTSNPAGTTYVEGTDFVLDYELGKIRHLAAGAVGANDVLVTYTYHAIRQGENAEIERAKVTLSYQDVSAIAYRLADQISSEAIVFSRSQIGWDAVTRTMANLIRQIRLEIDRALIEKALAAALGVAGNIAGTWDISDAVYLDFVKLLGIAKVKVANRYYEPTSILMSVTNADYLSNWDGFRRDGFPNAILNAAGYTGSVKGLPVFSTPVMRDTWNLVSNREIVLYRVYQPMTVKGPFPTYSSNGKLIAADQYYAEEYNASIAPIGGKGSVVKTQA